MRLRRPLKCEFCGGRFSIDDGEPLCCEEQEASYAEFMASIREVRDHRFWPIVGQSEP